MSVLTYLRRVLHIYAGGGEEYLSETLDDRNDDERYPFRDAESFAVGIASVLAGGRMTAGDLNPDAEDSLVRLAAERLDMLGNFYEERPRKFDLIEIGIVMLILKRLESGNARIFRLDLLSIALPADLKRLQKVFSEAHLNYLLGNYVSVAVLSRSLLEEALKDRLAKDASLVELIGEAEQKGYLRGEPLKWANCIRKMGNEAAHGDKSFSKYLERDFEEMLVRTRNILEAFYRPDGVE